MFDAATLAAYLVAAAVLVFIPGPGTAWIVAQSAAGGTARGIQAAFGLETATLIHALAAGLGLSALLATSALAFEVLKYAGAAYLIWLGIKAWRGAPAAAAEAAAAPPLPVSARQVYLRSVMTGVLNPKVALFFLAFLPQFVHPERGMVWLQFLVLGALLSLIGMCNSLMLSVAVGRFGRRFAGGGGRWKERLTGSVFIALGLRLAVQQR
ncbi:LysE family translocator [Lysobacter enzymogenes]|jgi:threonine/homoserine/homoserine lactone efflux protein|uniref:Lysine exporter protein LysE/YggA n=1 Tax=Lysobacter enzymogenes TaxID=69 RepID=A0AAU9AT47_LYSEN|nr:LysE family translocator [Lysobacter enzymogenes]BAV99143.1 lysine exporter protein LysE/YggA [Lysobacter enzymogenes]SDW61033.1 Threonine/homoserine/homoserine lactone efflux protein [Lysobacter enzymogenes]